jgi:heat shock protein HslJ
MTGLRPSLGLMLAVVAGVCGGGLAGGSFASGTVNAPSGGLPMASIPVENFDGAWSVQKVQDVDLHGFAELRFDFVAGTLYGSSPCRSFTTTFGPDPSSIMFTPFDIGGGLCDEETMIAERDFFQQLALVNRLALQEDGQLVMYSFDQPLLWAKRLVG